MKKLLSVLLALALLSCSAQAVFAIESTDRGNKQSALREQLSEKRDEFEAKREKWNTYKDTLTQKREQVLTYRNDNIALIGDCGSLKSEIKSAVLALKASGGSLSKDQLTTLQSLAAQAAEIAASLKSTAGDIKTLVQENKAHISAKDYSQMDAVFDQIYAVQTSRNGQLKELKGILGQIRDIVQ